MESKPVTNFTFLITYLLVDSIASVMRDGKLTISLHSQQVATLKDSFAFCPTISTRVIASYLTEMPLIVQRENT